MTSCFKEDISQDKREVLEFDSDTWLKCRKKLMGNITFQNGRKARNTWLTGANATLLAYANKKIEELDTRRKKITKAIADLSVETISQQQIDLLSGYLDDWENVSFEDKRKATDGLISSVHGCFYHILSPSVMILLTY